MKKSVLVLDTPKSCWMCPIATGHSASEVSVYCPVIGKYITGKDCESVSEHCPLRPLPELQMWMELGFKSNYRRKINVR